MNKQPHLISTICAAFLLVILLQSSLYAETSPNTKAKSVADSYQDDDVLISFKRAYLKKAHFCMDIELEIVAENKIIHLADTGRSVELSDNFGNVLGRSPSTTYFGFHNKKGLRPGQTKIFTVEFNNQPLKNTEYLVLKVPVSVFGNSTQFDLKITDFSFTTDSQFEDWRSENSFPPDEISTTPHNDIEKNRFEAKPFHHVLYWFMNVILSFVIFLAAYRVWRSLSFSKILKVISTLSLLLVLAWISFGVSVYFYVPGESPIVIIFVVLLLALGSLASLWFLYGMTFLACKGILALKRKCPQSWTVILSAWFAIAIFIFWSVICFSSTDYEDTLTRFIIGSLCIVAVLAAVAYTVNSVQKHKAEGELFLQPPK